MAPTSRSSPATPRIEVEDPTGSPVETSRPGQAAIHEMRQALLDGRDWPTALLEAMARWTPSEEEYEGRHLKYFIEAEAFDWLLLAERLCRAVDGLIPEDEREELLFHGKFPPTFDRSRFQGLLGVEKFRGYLNYFYGVTTEECLQSAVEQEAHKRHLSNGNGYQDDFSEDVFARIYRLPRAELLLQFRQAKGYPAEESMSLTESKEFLYWLFKYRMEHSDKVKVASDTQKALNYLRRVVAASGIGPAPHMEV